MTIPNQLGGISRHVEGIPFHILGRYILEAEYPAAVTGMESTILLVTEYTDTKRQMDEEVNRWEQLSEELEALSMA